MTHTSTYTNAHNVTYESVFQADIVTQMQTQGWQVDDTNGYQIAVSLFDGHE